MTALICLLIGACLGVFAMCLVRTSARAEFSVADMEIHAAQVFSALESDRDLWRAETIELRDANFRLGSQLKSLEYRRRMVVKFARTLIDRADAVESAITAQHTNLQCEQEAVNG